MFTSLSFSAQNTLPQSIPPRDKTVSIVGSKRCSEEQYNTRAVPLYLKQGIKKELLDSVKGQLLSGFITPFTEKTSNIARKIVEEKDGYVLTGGGPGIMEAASTAAHNVKPDNSWSIAVKKWLPYHIEEISKLLKTAENPSDRSDVFSENSRYMVAMPGGTGTLQEIFTAAENRGYYGEDNAPEKIFLVGKEFYKPLMQFLKNAEEKELISDVDKKFELVDTEEEVINKIDFSPRKTDKEIFISA